MELSIFVRLSLPFSEDHGKGAMALNRDIAIFNDLSGPVFQGSWVRCLIYEYHKETVSIATKNVSNICGEKQSVRTIQEWFKTCSSQEIYAWMMNLNHFLCDDKSGQTINADF